nr:AGE family epimerase/isomerase [Microlunatus antarcticus]
MRFGRHVVRSDGLAHWLDDDGAPDPARTGDVYVAARMAHVYLLGGMRGVPGCTPLAARLLAGLATAARDREHGGWLEHVPDPAAGPTDPADPAPNADKQAYTHAFVVLAGATATVAGESGGPALLADALRTTYEVFADPGTPLFVDSVSADLSVTRPYRGLNANMHLVEALLAAADATGDRAHAERAGAICAWVEGQVRTHGWRIPEHYDERWVPQLEHNRDHPDDPFRPYGATIGHAFEWARLMLQTGHALGEPDRHFETSARLFDRAVEDGWVEGEHPGFVYTTGWDGVPVVPDRVFWVPAEAIGAAAALAQLTGEPRYRERYVAWWDHVAGVFVDEDRGSWHHQLDTTNSPTSTIWSGKPDLYHAYQAVLLSRLPVAASLAGAVASERG